jgi:hypothetical protein
VLADENTVLVAGTGFNQNAYKKSRFENFCRSLSVVPQNRAQPSAEDIQEGQTEVQTQKTKSCQLRMD